MDDTAPSCPLLDRALLLAAATDAVAAAEKLLEQGANVNARDHEGASPLMRAAAAGHTALAQLLLTRGADPQLTDRSGNTARRLAEQAGHAEIVRLLTPGEQSE